MVWNLEYTSGLHWNLGVDTGIDLIQPIPVSTPRFKSRPEVNSRFQTNENVTYLNMTFLWSGSLNTPLAWIGILVLILELVVSNQTLSLEDKVFTCLKLKEPKLYLHIKLF